MLFQLTLRMVAAFHGDASNVWLISIHNSGPCEDPTRTWHIILPPRGPSLLFCCISSCCLWNSSCTMIGTNPTKDQGRVEDPRYCATMCHMSIMFHESWINTKRKAPSGRRSKNSLLQMKSDNSVWQPLSYLVRPELRGSNISFRTIASDLGLSLCICTLCHFAVVSPDPVHPVPHTCLCQLLLQLLSGLQFLGSAEEICELVESALVLMCLFHSTKFCLVQWHYTQNFDIYHLIHTTS